MIKTDYQKTNSTLAETISVHGPLDITGEDWDWGINFYCEPSLDECEDYYDKVMYLIGCNVYVTKLVTDWYTCTTIEQFVIDHKQTFIKFMQEIYRPEYIIDWDSLPEDEEEFYEEFIDGLMVPLIAGDFTESDYGVLYNLLINEK